MKQLVLSVIICILSTYSVYADEIDDVDLDIKYEGLPLNPGISLEPWAQGGFTVQEYIKEYFVDPENPELLLRNINYLNNSLLEQARAIDAGDLSRIKTMLTVQAHTLDAIFNSLARRAINVKHIGNLERYLRLALQAQSQCKSTLELLSTVSKKSTVDFIAK